MPQVELNTSAPDFSMEDYSGREFILSSLEGEKNVLLVLNRGFV